MRKQVIYAKLHGGDAFVPGLGAIGNTLDPTNKVVGSKTMDMTLYYTDYGLEWSLFRNGKRYEGVFPHANVQIAVYAETTVTTGGSSLGSGAQLKAVANE